MMIKTTHIVVLALTLLPALGLASGPPADVAAECQPGIHELPLATATGSVSIIKNMAEDPSSIRAIAGRLLASALHSEATVGNKTCDTACLARQKSEIVYRVAPTAYLAADLQRAECRKFESETSAHPLIFNQREFHSVDELNEWIMAFSQGRGADGRLLYERCSSNCSPRYTFLIAEQNSSYAVRTEVLCGLARDKSKDAYQVSTAVRRTCALN